MDTVVVVLYVFAFVLAVIATFNPPARWNLLAGAFAFFMAGVLVTALPLK
jgi:hypothetical protein